MKAVALQILLTMVVGIGLALSLTFGAVAIGHLVGDQAVAASSPTGHEPLYATDTTNFLIAASVGALASIFLGVLLWKLRNVNTAARIWCWLFGFSVLVMALPVLSILRNFFDTRQQEAWFYAVMVLAHVLSCGMWFLLIPIWRPFDLLTD